MNIKNEINMKDEEEVVYSIKFEGGGERVPE
jgi:hypothetical protein